MPKAEDSDIFPVVEWTPVSVRFTPSEHAVIKDAAARRGISLNSFVRQVSRIVAEKTLLEPSPDDELRRITLSELAGKPLASSKDVSA